jgi:NarL family two-component system response regulator LiaR
LIADDHPLVRDALKNLIGYRADMVVIGEASNGKEAVALAEELQPRIVIMDISMPVMNGLEATRAIKARCPDIAILALTIHTDREHILSILEAGAAGYLPKIVFGNDVIHAVQSIANGEAVLSQEVLQQIMQPLNQETSEAAPSDSYSNLTSREISIIRLAARGLSNKKIAAELFLNEGTIKSYLVDIFSKMAVSSRTEAVIKVLKAGFVQLGDLE